MSVQACAAHLVAAEIAADLQRLLPVRADLGYDSGSGAHSNQVTVPVVKKQLYHLATTINGDAKASLRVLPVHAVVEDFTVPRCTFSIYTYPDPGDPDVVAIDTVTSDLILTEPDQAAPYERLYGRLRDAALPPADSLDLLTKAAAELPDH